jgi:hypothetical protein
METLMNPFQELYAKYVEVVSLIETIWDILF